MSKSVRQRIEAAHQRKPVDCECGDHCWVVATRGYIVLASPEDKPTLAAGPCHIGVKVRKSRSVPYLQPRLGHIALARALLNPPKHLLVDHIDGNTLDNRRPNLRLCTPSQNTMNQTFTRAASGIKGVYFNPQRQRFNARIAAGGKKVNLGYFPTAEAASIAYCEAAAKLHGEFANTKQAKPRST